MKVAHSLSLFAAVARVSAQSKTLQALIYRGPQSCGYDPDGDPYGCSEAAAKLLTSSSVKASVTYAGPNEDIQIDADTLSNYDIYVQPGGGDLAPAWKELGHLASTMHDYVSNGGLYIGICLGAYLAGPQSGYNLLPDGWTVAEEIDQNNTQVSNTSNTVIQVNWDFTNGPQAGTTANGQWLFFQDGAVMLPGDASSSVQILGNYTGSGDAAATLSPLGKGWVGLIGPHPEAPAEWYTDPDLPHPFSNPDGVKYDIGHDFMEAVVNAGKSSPGVRSSASTSPTTSAPAQPTASANRAGLNMPWMMAVVAGVALGII